jgi:perosamine synthetase
MLPLLGDDEAMAAAEAVRSGWVAQGPRVARFEAEFAAAVGAAHGVAVSSCTTGLHLALLAVGVGPGDEVIVPSLSFIATANAARYVGATPVFADVELATGNLTVETIDAVRTPRTRAVIAVHQGGVPFDVAALRAAATEWGVALVEDAACAAGSTIRSGHLDGKPVGTGALIAAWSFHPRKLITTGEGGMITVDNGEWATRLRRLREHGMNVSAADRHASAQPILEAYLETGYNYRMTDIQAAIGLVQLGKLDAIVAQRRALAARYHDLLADVPGAVPVRDPAHGTTNYQSFWVLLTEEFRAGRDEVLAALAAVGVSARRGIMASHLEPAYAGSGGHSARTAADSGGHSARTAADSGADVLPNTERITRDSLILPLHHLLTEDDQDYIVGVLRGLSGAH